MSTVRPMPSERQGTVDPLAHLPRLRVEEPEAKLLDRLRGFQDLLLLHPVAAQAAFSGLVAEGRRYAETGEGAEWLQRLAGSDLARRGRVVWEVVTMKMLEEQSEDVLPSAYLDALIGASASGELEPLLAKLFEDRPDEIADPS